MTRKTTRGTLRWVAAMTISGAIALGAAVPASAGDMPYESKIRLKNSFPAFHGLVKSDGSACIANREVRLFREQDGEDNKIGKTRTDSEGKWEILKEPKSGVFYAKVNEYGNEELELLCLSDTSKKIVID